MRLILLLLLLVPSFSQDDTPIIAVEPTIRYADIYTLREGQAPMLLAEADVPELFLSPDGQKLAILDYPAFVSVEDELEPGDYPDDLAVIDLTSGERKALLTHDDNMTLDSASGDQFYSGDRQGGVRADRAWDDPNSIGGSRLFHFLAWSPESDRIAQVQTVVSDGQYPGVTQLVMYDVATGGESVITDLGASQTGYAVFWFDEGIVLYTDPKEGNDQITVFAPNGEVLHQWELDSRWALAHENPVRFMGQDFITFPKWFIFYETLGTFTLTDTTIALVNAAAPENSLIIEECDDRENLRPTWDIYGAGGEKLTNLTQISAPTLSPDGQQIAYVNYTDGAVTVFDGSEAHPLDVGEGAHFEAQTVIWGATTYTLTPIGVDECRRGPARG